MTFYLHPYPFGFAQDRPYRQMARRAIQRNGEPTLGINIREQDDAYILSALVPGLSAEDLNIQVLEDVLRIEGESKGADNDVRLATERGIPVYYRLEDVPGCQENTLHL